MSNNKILLQIDNFILINKSKYDLMNDQNDNYKRIYVNLQGNSITTCII